MIVRQSGISLCHQIKEGLRRELDGIGYGEQVPTEQQLSAQYGVSRGTVRQAITELVNEGLLYKVQGRGTFKGGIAVSHSRHVVRSFTEQLLSIGLHPGIRSVELTTAPAPERVAHFLHIDSGAAVWKLTRTRLANNQPIARCSAYLLKSVLPQLSAEDLEMSLMAMLKEKQLPLVQSESFCTAGLADAGLAEQLGVAPGAPVLRIEYVGFLEGKQPALVDIMESLGDKYILRIEQGM